jgi:hypothetical protein
MSCLLVDQFQSLETLKVGPKAQFITLHMPATNSALPSSLAACQALAQSVEVLVWTCQIPVFECD